MDYNEVIIILKEAIMTILTTASPILIAALVAGLTVSIFQATTQINEQTMALIPKILVVFTTLVVLGPWLIQTVSEYAINLYDSIIRIILS